MSSSLIFFGRPLPPVDPPRRLPRPRLGDGVTDDCSVGGSVYSLSVIPDHK